MNIPYEKGTITYVRIPPLIRSRLQRMATKEHRTLCNIIVFLLEQSLDAIEKPWTVGK